jgi:hypothetical protein
MLYMTSQYSFSLLKWLVLRPHDVETSPQTRENKIFQWMHCCQVSTIQVLQLSSCCHAAHFFFKCTHTSDNFLERDWNRTIHFLSAIDNRINRYINQNVRRDWRFEFPLWVLYLSIPLDYYTLHTIIQFRHNATVYSFTFPFQNMFRPQSAIIRCFTLPQLLYCIECHSFTSHVLCFIIFNVIIYAEIRFRSKFDKSMLLNRIN